MLRIETEMDGPRIVFRLIGRLQYNCLETVRQRLPQGHDRPVVLDLAEVTLIDLPSVRFLRGCQDRQIELRNCSPYITEWIRRERAEDPHRSSIAEN